MIQKEIKIGWASGSITPDRPIFLIGQLYYRISSYVHDPLTATALALDNVTSQAVMVSCDMTLISGMLVKRLKKRLNGYNGLDSKNVSVSAIHTHTSTNFTNDIHRDSFKELLGEDKILEIKNIPENVLDGEALQLFWLERISDIIKKAWDQRKKGGISFASDYACVAFNRRPVFKNDKGEVYSKMYGDCSQKSFQGFEGTFDHSVEMLFTWDESNSLTGVLVDVPCPSQVMELHDFISADYWGYARGDIREKLKKNIYVLPICGAAGDENPIDLVRISKENSNELGIWNAQSEEVWCNYDPGEICSDIGDRISDSVVRGFKKSGKLIQKQIEFYHKSIDMALPIRRVTEEDYKKAQKTIKSFCAQFSPEHRMDSHDQVSMFNSIGYIERWKLQNVTKDYHFSCHIMRIGNAAISSFPFELFTDYALRIKARVEAGQIILLQLTDDTGGYLPTKKALEGGSYSSEPVSTLTGPESGELLVEKVITEMNKLWSTL